MLQKQKSTLWGVSVDLRTIRVNISDMALFMSYFTSHWILGGKSRRFPPFLKKTTSRFSGYMIVTNCTAWNGGRLFVPPPPPLSNFLLCLYFLQFDEFIQRKNTYCKSRRKFGKLNFWLIKIGFFFISRAASFSNSIISFLASKLLTFSVVFVLSYTCVVIYATRNFE